MERLIRSLLALFSRPVVEKRSTACEPGARTEKPEADADAIARLATGLRSWLLRSQQHRSSKRSDVERSKLTELHERVTSRQLSRIPRQPRVLPKLIRALGDESSSHTDVALIIRDEPALTNDLLTVVNKSAEKRGQLPVDSVEHAVLLVGFDGVRRAISQAVTRPIMQGGSRLEAEFARRAWRWGMMCATACDLLEQEETQANSEIFMIGLMPAFGYLTIYRELESISLDQTGERSFQLPTLEAAFNESLESVLACLVEAWQLPASFDLQLRDLREMPLGAAETRLSKGMVIGTNELLRRVAATTLTRKELLLQTRVDPRTMEKVLKQLQ